MKHPLPAGVASRLRNLAVALVDQSAADVVVPPLANAPGFWFGGGNVIANPNGGVLLCGRYRNAGDSRTGIAAGERGLELAVFKADHVLADFRKILAFSKDDLSVPAPVISIEGAALLATESGIELFVSTEKDLPYPTTLSQFQKPGTGVWSIDLIEGETVQSLALDKMITVLSSVEGPTLHLKDPDVFRLGNGDTAMIFCSHPHTWSSSNTGSAIRPDGKARFRICDPDDTDTQILQRGPVWDVACCRVTDRLDLPRVGILSDCLPLSLYFYDGAECLRALDENPAASRRPRGYSCEELGGVAWGPQGGFPQMHRLSELAPLFVSPHASGCSRYVSTFQDESGVTAFWQQAQVDGSQPLVRHHLPMRDLHKLLGA